jgi:hypothetical protein
VGPKAFQWEGVIKIWTRGQNLLKFQSARNAMKMVPLRPSHLPDSGGIFTFSNGVRMEKISRSVRRAKQAKKNDADCTCPYSPYGDVAGRTFHTMTCQK